METKEILEGNKLIAEFMGYYIRVEIPEDYLNHEWHWMNNSNNDIHGLCVHLDSKELKEERLIVDGQLWESLQRNIEYHTSWNWLMPVVEKIESLGFYTVLKKASDDTQILIIKHFEAEMYGIQQPPIWRTTKLEATYVAVVEFIKWYNQSSK